MYTNAFSFLQILEMHLSTVSFIHPSVIYTSSNGQEHSDCSQIWTWHWSFAKVLSHCGNSWVGNTKESYVRNSVTLQQHVGDHVDVVQWHALPTCHRVPNIAFLCFKRSSCQTISPMWQRLQCCDIVLFEVFMNGAVGTPLGNGN